MTVRVLSPVEERIAQLAARGQSDRGVAAELGISPQSVERHLSRVFRKLGARTRAELPALLASTRMPGGEPVESALHAASKPKTTRRTK